MTRYNERRNNSMALSPGTHFGPYEIVSLVGAGGMGEVYRARDTHLKREVAIKVLPDAFAEDPDRLSRFQREAELLASLNHPNIASIYGLEKTDSATAIVLELVDGETLAALIDRGPVAIDEALPIARAIADALEAAHEKGVIHRDLKPANVKITSDGKVKVLDFGLAKMIEAPGSSGSARDQPTASPTLSVHATYAGVILGTAAYMSPEQARGRPVDRRTDIWSFGCVLYEMLSGRQAFEAGETVSDAIAAILKNTPHFDALPADTPPHVRTLLRRCLHKDPQKRLPHIGLARLEMDEAPSDATVVPDSSRLPLPLWRRVLPAAVGVIVGVILTGGLAIWILRPPAVQTTVTRFTYQLPAGQAFRDLFLPAVAISPDGTRIAYVANQRVYIRTLSELTARPIAGTEIEAAGNIGSPVFSPDGQSIAFWTRPPEFPADMGMLKRIRLEGGSAMTLAQVRRPLGMSWSGDAILVGQPSDSGIVRVSANGGAPERIVAAKTGEFMQGPQMLPDSEAVLFTIATASSGLTVDDTWNKSQIVVQSLKSGERKTLIYEGTSARYLPTGHIIYAVGGVVLARTFDVRRLEVTGEAVPVIEGVAQSRLGQFSTGSMQMSVSNAGSLIYLPGPVTVGAGEQRDLVVVDRTGAIDPLKLPPRTYEHPRVSPDGKRIAFDTDDGKDAIVWISDLSGTTAPRQLTFEGRNRFPIWSRDGRRVVFQSDRGGARALFWQPADGAAPAERLTEPQRGMNPVPASWTADGKSLFFQVGSDGDPQSAIGSQTALWVLSLADRSIMPFAGIRSQSAVAPISATVSPDGRWIAYLVASEPSRAALRLFAQPLQGTRYLIATGAADPQWSPSGKEMLYLSLVGAGVQSTTITTDPQFAAGNPVTMSMGLINVWRRSRTGPGTPRNIDMMPDGQHFIAAVRHEDSESSTASQIQIVLNWADELKQRVPAR